MANPIWIKPIIFVNPAYFCALPQSIFSQIHNIMRSLAENANLVSALEKRRAAYLESKVQALLTTALPGAIVRSGIQWRIGGVNYETDHIALVDKTIVIVEDKSAALTGPGLRGAPDRVLRHVRDLIVDPSEQSARLEEILKRAKRRDQDALEALVPFNLDFTTADRILRMSVTLDDFSVLASAEIELRQASWFPKGLALAPTLNVADLETAIDILDNPSVFLHYLLARQRVQKDGAILADELDFLGSYLQSGLDFGDLEAQGISLLLTDASKPIDHYYDSIDAGISVPKPKVRVSKYFQSLFEAIEHRRFIGWTTVISDLLCCASHDQQLRLHKHLEALKKKVQRNWRDPAHDCSLVVQSHALQDAAVIFFVYPPELVSSRNERAQDLAGEILENLNLDRCTMICRNTSRWGEPYTSIMFLSRPKL